MQLYYCALHPKLKSTSFKEIEKHCKKYKPSIIPFLYFLANPDLSPASYFFFDYINNLTSNKSSKNHWAARAIKDGHTILTNDEMEDFLKMVQISTFGIFKIRTPSTASSSLQQQKQQHESIGLYLLALVSNDDTLYSLSCVPNKSNSINNSSNNNSLHSKSAEEAFSSLYNHLVNISNFTVPIVNSQS